MRACNTSQLAPKHILVNARTRPVANLTGYFVIGGVSSATHGISSLVTVRETVYILGANYFHSGPSVRAAIVAFSLLDSELHVVNNYAMRK